jgi:aryl-alcohol dehydrogenase-like predicted oxidoreductase
MERRSLGALEVRNRARLHEHDADLWRAGSGRSDRDTPPRGRDVRANMPRFSGDNLSHNLALVAELKTLAAAEGRTPAQLALAWLLSRDRSIVPSAGTSHRRWLAENAAAARLTISAPTLTALERIFRPGAAIGMRYPEAMMSRVGL